jgi:ABC-2 type transport system permease protein
MRNTLLIAKREYLEQVTSRSFRLTTALVPFVVVGLSLFFKNLNHGAAHMAGHSTAQTAGHGGHSVFTVAYVMAMLLTTTGVVYGLNVGRAILGEKASRIFEVMLASVRPEDLMFGKLIGVGAVGLTQIAIWMAMTVAFLTSKYSALLFERYTVPQISGFEIFLFCIYFLLGYLFYSAISAGMAATVSTEQELQQMMPLNAIPVWLSFGLMPYVSAHPDGPWALALSYIPPFSPIIIFIRLGAGDVPLWQIALSVGIMVLIIYGMIWFSTRLYRVGILMYGKRATLPEILRWIHYS